jgi:TPR repeat protein
MQTPTPWLYGLAVVVVLNIVASLFNSPAIRRFRLPLMLAAYVIGIALFSKLGVWPALALWWGIGFVIGLIGWSYEFRGARPSKDAEVKPPGLVTVVHGLFAWPITVPLKLLAALGFVVVSGVGNLCYSLYKKLLPNYVPHYRGIEGCKEAAISGDARAQFNLGCGFESGEYGLPQDYVESAKWFRKAAEQNHYAAQLRLGIYLAEGKGVEKNVVEGLMWIVLSAHVSIRHGGGRLFRDAAHQESSRTKAQMTEQQIAEAWVMLDSSPLYKEFKERLDRSASQPAPEKSPPAQP